MFCSPKKPEITCTSIHFLGHIISPEGVHADPAKINAITNWPIPTSATAFCLFFGLVCYIAVLLQNLAIHMVLLMQLTTNEFESLFPVLNPTHQWPFQFVLVLSTQCLAIINHEDPGNNVIFVTCDTSDLGTSAILSFGASWEECRPDALTPHNYCLWNEIILYLKKRYSPMSKPWNNEAVICWTCKSKFTWIKNVATSNFGSINLLS